MKVRKPSHLLWRVDWYHRGGYQAPMQFVEAEKRKQALSLAKKQSRLGDFTSKWSCKLTKLSGPEKA